MMTRLFKTELIRHMDGLVSQIDDRLSKLGINS